MPPILAALVEAAEGTALRQLWPFQSLNRLCFATGPEWWAGHGTVVPVFIERTQDGTYAVHTGDPYSGSADCVCRTVDTGEAAAVTAVRSVSHT